MAGIAFLGLGVMGYPMAGHLAKAGHDVTVYNRTASKAQAWVAQHGGAMAATPADAAKGADFVMSCVGNDDDLRGVSLGDEGAFSTMSGGQAGAENGVLSVMCGGEADVYARAEPVIDAYARVCRRIGDSGAGQMTKMCNQIAIAGLVQGLSEALHFAEKAGLDGRAVV